MKERISCRKARGAIQDALDRGCEDLTRFLPRQVRFHLERCAGCREFSRSLGTFAPVLRSQLDEALRSYPEADFAAVLQGKEGKSAQDAGLQKHRGAAAAALRRFCKQLSGLARKPAPAYRWAAVSAIAVLAASLIAIRIYSISTTQRAIEQQIDRVVELIYEEPLLPGIESALLRTRPTISEYVEDLDRSIETWLEETDAQSYFN